LLAVGALADVKFIIEADRIVAMILGLSATGPESDTASMESDPAAPACAIDRSVAITPPLRSAFGGVPERIDCVTATEAIAAVGDDLVIVTAGDKPRRLASVHLPGLVFAGATHIGGRDELLAVTTNRTAIQTTWSVVALRWEAGRLTRTFEDVAYQLTDRSAGWLGAQLGDLDLVLNLEARATVVVTSGVLLRRRGPLIGLAVPLAPVSLARRKRPALESTAQGEVALPQDARRLPIDAGKP